MTRTKKIGRLQLGFKKWGKDMLGLPILLSKIILVNMGLTPLFLALAHNTLDGPLHSEIIECYGFCLGSVLVTWLLTGLVRLCYLRVYVVKEGKGR